MYDDELLEEIALYGELVAAAGESDRVLSREEIDLALRVLHAAPNRLDR